MPQIDLVTEFQKKQNELRLKLDEIINKIGYDAMEKAFGKNALEKSYTPEKHQLTSIETSASAMHLLGGIASDLFLEAKDEHLVMKLDHGPQLQIYVTPEQFLERLADGLGTTSDAISLITPEAALNEVNAHFKAATPAYQAMNQNGYLEDKKNLEEYMYAYLEDGKPAYANNNDAQDNSLVLAHV